MDDEILKTVESILGKNIKIVDIEKKSSIREEEILLINGIPIKLEGDDGNAIKKALMTGQIPSCDLLNQLLYRAGVLGQPIHLETSLSVKSSTITKEEVTVARDGQILDEHSSETKEDNYYSSSCKELWEPINKLCTIKTNIPNKSIINKKINNDNVNISPSNSGASETSSSSLSSVTPPPEKCSIYSDINSISNISIKSNQSMKLPNKICVNEQLKNLNYLNNNNNNNNKKNCIEKSISCDSGHEDLFNSSSQANCLLNTNTNNSMSSCYDFISSDEADFIKSNSDPLLKMDTTSSGIMPTIFGTVASDQSPKDNTNRRGLPQTTNISTKSIDKNLLPSSSTNTVSSLSGYSFKNDNKNDTIDIDENSLVYRDGNLISGPLDALIQHMVPTSDYYPDRSYLFAFLLSARLFIRPHELLAKICQLCEEQQNISDKIFNINNDNNDSGIIKLNHTNSSLSTLSVSPPPPPPPPQTQTTTTTTTSTVTPITTTISTTNDKIISDNNIYYKLQNFAKHFIQLLAEWIETFPYDFRDERLMQHVRYMTKKCININNDLRKDVSSILQNLLQRLTILEKYEEYLQNLTSGNNEINIDGNISNNLIKNTGNNIIINNDIQLTNHTYTGNTFTTSGQNLSILSTTTPVTNGIISIDISEFCPNSTLLAHQLTHIELERLSYIGPEEFVQAFAKENPHLEQSFNDIKKTRNLESYVQWFNRLSYLVATEIVKHSKKKQRVRIVEYWIETARECFNIGNFNSLMAIIAGLNMSPISRLKKTWAKVQSAKFSVLEHQMDPSSNFNSYRSTLKAAMWRSAGATDERERIVIPFFSLLVKDLYFLNEGCSNKLPNGHINFEKFWQLAKQVTEFIAWKQVTCPFEKLPKIIMFLQTNHILNENTLAMASFECEPPDNNHEKDRYKSLKSEQNIQN